MNWLRVYHALPYPLRVLAASHHGHRLRRQRYDARTSARVREALEREAWSAGEWAAWQAERLRPLLALAATRVPYYRNRLRQRGDGRAGPADDLSRWPVLGKEALRADPRSFIVEGVKIRDLDEDHTSGSTGTPLRLWRSRDTSQAWYGLWEARCRTWHGASRHDRWAILGGRLVTPVTQRRPPFWVWNSGLHQLYLSSYHLTAANARHYRDALARHRVRHVLGYPSALHALAVEVLAQGLRMPELDLVLANGEPLLDHQRRAIAEAFGCPVRSTYGLGEITIAASECREGRMHLWPEVGIVEVLRIDEDRPAAPGEVGRLVATGLLNDRMPLVRYEMGDLGAVDAPGDACPCGRRLPILSALVGRLEDLIVSRDGRRLCRFEHTWRAIPHLLEAQVVQESIDDIRVSVVAEAGFTARHADEVVRRLRQQIGDVRIRLERVAALPRSASGKLRTVLSRLPPETR